MCFKTVNGTQSLGHTKTTSNPSLIKLGVGIRKNGKRIGIIDMLTVNENKLILWGGNVPACKSRTGN